MAFVGEHISDVTLDFSAPLAFLDGVSSGKDNIYKSLVTYASEHLNTTPELTPSKNARGAEKSSVTSEICSPTNAKVS